MSKPKLPVHIENFRNRISSAFNFFKEMKNYAQKNNEQTNNAIQFSRLNADAKKKFLNSLLNNPTLLSNDYLHQQSTSSLHELKMLTDNTSLYAKQLETNKQIIKSRLNLEIKNRLIPNKKR